jgi:hypothetical protein
MDQSSGFHRVHTTMEEQLRQREHPSTWVILAIFVGMLCYMAAEAMGLVE